MDTKPTQENPDSASLRSGDLFGLSANAMEVSSIFGYTRALEYVNQVRSILNAPAMSESEYKAAEDECMKAGRDLVVAAHRSAADSFFWSNGAAQTRRT